jgi:hypothetical protein
MRGNDHERTTLRATLTATGILDHAAIEARARQLRREALADLADVLIRRVARAWASVTRWGAARAWSVDGRARRCCEEP